MDQRLQIDGFGQRVKLECCKQRLKMGCFRWIVKIVQVVLFRELVNIQVVQDLE